MKMNSKAIEPGGLPPGSSRSQIRDHSDIWNPREDLLFARPRGAKAGSCEHPTVLKREIESAATWCSHPLHPTASHGPRASLQSFVWAHKSL